MSDPGNGRREKVWGPNYGAARASSSGFIEGFGFVGFRVAWGFGRDGVLNVHEGLQV